MKDVYLNKIKGYLPNKPVTNDEMEQRLGFINGKESINRGLILRSNQIETRFYALDENGIPTHTNAELTAVAIRKLFDEKFKIEDLNLLTTGTSSPDSLQPSHALMVHGELGGSKSIEVMSAHGTCNSGMISLKYACMSIMTGEVENAVCAASETYSSWMHARNFEEEIDKRKEIEENPYIAFEKDFLRWMLSDGAAAMLLQNKPNDEGLSLKIEWIEIRSFANELQACMYAGGEKNDDGSLRGWKEMTEGERNRNSVFSLKQDARLLQNNIILTGIGFLKQIMEKHNFLVSDFDYFMPHMSSMFFKKKIYKGLKERGIHIPYEMWFTNLVKIGNIGAASSFFMIEELFNSGNLKKGEKMLVMVPESARFSYAYMMLKVV